jgi:hypothetical protein
MAERRRAALLPRHRLRAFTRRLVPRTRKSRAATALVVMLVGLLVYVLLGQPQIVPAGPPPPDHPRLREFRVVYRVTDSAGETPAIRTEILDVRRPYESRVEDRREPPERDDGGAVSSASVTNREFFWALKEGNAVNYGARRVPAGTQRDYSYAAFRDGVRHGSVTSSGDTKILGRTCTLFAYKEPFPKPFSPPTLDDGVETCLTRDGIVLRESWTFSGKRVRTQEAVRMTTRVPDPSRAFLLTHGPPSGQATEYIEQQQKVTEDKVLIDGRPFRPVLASGFVVGRRASLSEQAEIARSAYFETYVRGPDVATLEQGTTASGEPPFDRREGSAVRVGSRTGRILFFPDRVEIRMTIGTTYVRIRAPDEALARYFATTLRRR